MINKKIAILVSGFVFLLSAVLYYGIFSGENPIIDLPLMNRSINKPTITSTIEPSEDTGPKTEACPLNGEMLTKAQKAKWEKRRPLGVMIENHVDARPQSGLAAADIVYEVVAEGGITRFLAIFYCKDAPYVGPIRSARIYFIKILQEYGRYPLYAHVGGANTPGPADALGEIRNLGWNLYNDLNQFAIPFPYYWRDYERLPGRVTEHTVYSSTEKLWQYAATVRKLTNDDEDGEPRDKGFENWLFTDDAKMQERGETKKIAFRFWNNFADQYAVSWVYDVERNSYRRNNGGSPHLDKNTDKQLEAKNVLIIFSRESPANDGYEGGHILYKLTGSGEAFLFNNGQSIKGSWQRIDEETRMKVFDDKGNEVEFVRGKIWIEVLPIGTAVVTNA